MGDKERGKGVEEQSGRRFRGPRGNLTNSSTRAEGISEASEGQMQLRERASQKVNKVDRMGLMGCLRTATLDGEDHCSQEEREGAFLSQERTGKCQEWLRKHSLCREEKKGIAKGNSGSWKKPGKGWSCQMVGMWAVMRESRQWRAESTTPRPPPGQKPQVGSPASPRLAWGQCSAQSVSDSATPWTAARQAPLSMGFSRQEYWSGLPCPPPGDLTNPGSNPGLPQCRQVLYHLGHQGRPYWPHLSPSSSDPLLSGQAGSWPGQPSGGPEWRHSSVDCPHTYIKHCLLWIWDPDFPEHLVLSRANSGNPSFLTLIQKGFLPFSFHQDVRSQPPAEHSFWVAPGFEVRCQLWCSSTLACDPWSCWTSAFTKNYWSVVDLHCCISFRYTAKWISHTYIHSFSDFFSM